MIRWFSVLILASLLLPMADGRAQEPTEEDAKELTEPERLARQLAESQVQSDRALGTRWDRLIRRRQWVNSTGKHKIYAKYLDHDPDLKWVKLLALNKQGKEQAEKVIQVELKRLDKKDQALVKRIALAREKVLAALPDSKSEKEENQFGPPSRRGHDPTAENFEEATEADVSYPSYEDYARIAAGRPTGEEAYEEAKPPLDHNTPDLLDEAPWRTSYRAFVANMSAKKIVEEGDESDLSTWQLEWGELEDIRLVWEGLSAMTRARSGHISQEEAFQAQLRAGEARPRVGEVLWEAVLLKPVGPKGGEISFDLPQPPKPFRFRFRLDNSDPGPWKGLKQGSRVRFIGRIQPYSLGTPIVTFEIRFPDEQPGDAATNQPSGP